MKMNKLRFQSKILCLCVSLLFTGSVWAQQALLQGGSGSTQLSGAVFTTSEEGASASSSFRLNIAPTSTLTVSIQGLDTTEHRVTPPSFTFTTAQGVSGGFNNAQTFTINPVDDMFADGTVSYDVTFLVEGGGVGWDGLETTITLVNQDDEAGVLWTFGIAPNIEVLSSYTTEEAITTQQLIRVALTEQPAPPDSSVTFSVTVGGDSNEITIHPQTQMRTFTSVNYDTRQAVAFFAVDDTEVDGNRPYTFDLEVTASTATNYPVGTVFSLPGINEDNEAPPADTTAPTLSSSMTENTMVTLAYSEELDPISVPSLAAYTLTVTPTPTTGNELTLSDVSILGQNVILTLSRAPTDTENLNLTYVVPSTNPVQDLAPTPNPAAAFAGLAVKTAGLSVSIADVTVDENVGNAEVTVTVAGTSTAAITATVTITDGTATVTEDYNTPLSNSLTIGTGLATAIIAIPITDDMIDEDSEDFTVTLSNLAGGGGLALTLDNATATVTITDDDTAGFTVVDGGDGTTTSENETSDSFTVVLDSQPTANVELLIGIDATEHTLTTPPLGILTFTPSDWATAQQVTLRGEDDDVFDGDQTYNLMLMLRGGGTGTGYGSVTLPTVEVTNTDNDTAPDSITLSIDPSSVAETADATTITVTATIDGTVVLPTATDVAVTVGGGTATVTTDYTATPSTLTITIPAETLSATGTFMIDPNTSSDNGDTVMVTGTAPSFTTINPATLTIFEAGVSVYEAMTGGTPINTVTIAEAGSDTLYVQLASQPASNVTLSVTSSDANEGMVSTGSLTFSTANWATRQALTVNAVNDNVDRDGDSFMVEFEITTGDGGNYTTGSLPGVTVTVTDDDTAPTAITLSIDPSNVAETAGATTVTVTATIGGTVVLSTPTDVTVSVGGGTATGSGTDYADVTGFTLTIPALSASATQTFMITPVDDGAGDSGETVVISGTATGFTTITPATLTIVEASVSVYEAMTGGTPINTVTIAETSTDTLYVQLASQPASDVTLSVTSSDTGEGTVDTATLTFTNTNWNTRRAVIVTAVDDNIVRADTFMVNFEVTTDDSGAGGDYTTGSLPGVTVTVTDDDTAPTAITLSIDPSNVPETAGATTVTVTATIGGTVVLSTDTVVTVSVGGGTATGSGTDYADVADVTLTIPALSASATQTFMITPVDDGAGDSGETVVISGTATGFTTITPATLTIVEASVSVYEAMTGGTPINTVTIAETSTDTLYVQLASQPASDVTLSVTSSDTGEGTVDTATLTFTNTNWNTRRAVIVTAVDDNIVRADTFMVNFEVTTDDSGAGGDYTTGSLPGVTVTVTDDDTAPTAITLSIDPSNVPETAGATTVTVTATIGGTVVLSTDTVVTVSVGGGTATGSGTDYADVADVTLTIPALSASATQTFMITPVDDGAGDSGETVVISGTATGFTTITPATLTIVEASVSVYEAMTGGTPINTVTIAETSTDTLYVQLASQPASDVTLSVTSSDTGEGTVDTATLTFTNTNWNTRRAVIVTAVDDNIVRADTFMVNFEVTTDDSGAGGDYTTGSLPGVTVTVTDDDTAPTAITLSIDPSNVPETAGATTVTVTATIGGTVVLSTPTDVTVSVGGGTATGSGTDYADVTGFTLTIPALSASATQTFMITPVDDGAGDSGETVVISGTATGFTTITPATLTIVEASVSVYEAMTGGTPINTVTIAETSTDTLYVQLASQPASDVTLSVTSSDTGEGTVDTATLTFTNTNWNTRRAVIVTAVDDNIVRADTFMVNFEVTTDDSGAGGDYTTGSLPGVTVTVTDDDTAPTAITLSIDPSNVPETAGATTVTVTATIGGTVVLSTPTDVTVSVGGGTATGSGTDYADVTGFTLTIPALSASATQTFMITPVDDGAGDSGETVVISGTATGFTTITPATLTIVEASVSVYEAMTGGTPINTVTIAETSTDTLYVQLASQPASDVTLSVTSSDTGEGTVDTATLTFTNTNWNTRRAVIVTAVDDNIVRADTFMVNFEVTTDDSGAGGDYTTGSLPGVTVTVTDDDTAPTAITLSIDPSNVPETAGATTVTVTATIGGTVVLSTPTDVTVSVGGGTATGSGTDYADVTGFTLTIPALSASATQTFMITPVDDGAGDSGETVVISGTATGFTTITPATLTIVEASVSVYEAMTGGTPINTVTIAETSTDTLYVQLASQPASDVTLSVTSSDTGEGTVDTATLTFTNTNWNTRRAVIVTAVDDNIVRADTFMVNFEVTTDDSGAGGDYTTGSLPGVTVTVTDDDTAPTAITLSIDPSNVPETAGATTVTVTATIGGTVVLSTDTVVTVSVGGGTATGSGTDYADVADVTLTIPALSASATQTFMITPVDDGAGDSGETVVISGTATGFTTITPATLTIVEASVSVYEAMTGGTPINTVTIAETSTDTLYVQLASQPASDVTLSVTSSDTGEGTVDTATLTFTNTNWNTRRAVIVTAVDDNIVRADTFMVNFEVTTDDSGAGGDYTTGSLPGVTVTVTDDDTAPTAITLSIDPSNVPETAGATTVTVTATIGGTVVLSTDTVVTVSVGGGTATGSGTDYADVADVTLTIPALSASATQTFMITPVDDGAGDSGETVVISGTATGFTTITPATLTIVEASVSVYEAMTGGTPINTVTIAETSTDTLYVQLASQPASDVTLSVTSSDTGEGTVDTATLTFTNTNWNTRRAVIVTAVDDNIVRADTFMVNFEVTTDDSGAGGDYTTGSLPGVTVTVTDDDTAPTAITLSIDPSNVPETAGATTVTVTATIGGTVVLSTPTDVTVSVGGGTATGSGTDYADVTGFTLTIPALSASATQTFMITPVDDGAGDSGETVVISGTATGFTTITPATLTIVEASVSVYEAMTGGTPINTVTIAETSTDTLYVQLASQPASDVTLSVTSSDTGEGTVDTATLTFTNTNWNTRRAVIVTAVDDNIVRADTFMVNFEVTTDDSGAGGDYTTGSLPGVTVTVTDDDTAPTAITLSIDPSNVPETAGATTVTVTATIGGTVVLSTDTVVTVSVGGGTATGSGTDYADVADVTLTIPALSASATQTFMITPVDDGAGDSGETVVISGTATGFTTITPATLTIVEASVSVYEAMTGGTPINTVTIAETSTDTLYVQLASQPASDVTLSVTSSDTGEGTVDTATLTFTNTNWNTRRAVIVTAVDDNIVRADTFMVNFEVTTDDSGAGGDYTTGSLPGVTVTVTDDDTAPTAITLSIDPSNVPETAGATTVTVTATIGGTVVLSTDTVVTVSVGGGTATGSGTDYADVADVTLTIPALSASATQTFMITPVDDGAGDSGETVVISGTATGFTTITPATLTIVEASVSVYEAMTGGTPINTVTIAETSTDTLYVQLASQPASDVTLSVTSSDTGEGTVDTATLTFTNTNWNTRRAVIVTAVDDNIVRADTFMVNFEVTTDDSGAGGDYTTGSLPGVTVTVTDDDTVGLTVVDGGGVTTSETGTTGTFTVVLDSEPTDTVTVTITGLRAEEHTFPPLFGTTLTFTTANWSTVQTVTLTGVNDNDVDGDQTYTLTLTPTGGGYTGVTAPTVSVTNTDDDTAELTIADMMVNEGAGTATVTVTLTPAVTAGTVTVDATTADGTAMAGGDYTAITSQTLTFTAGSTSETLSITINDDNAAEGDETFTVMLDNLVQPTGVTTVSIATDDTAEVTITDNETAPTTIDLSINPSTVAETADATTITVTATIDGTAVLPTDTVVTVSVGGGTATATGVGSDYATVPDFTLTISALSSSATQTFMIDPTEDTTDDNNETVEISGTATDFTVSTAILTIVEAGILVFDAMMDGSQVSTVTIAEAGGSDMLYVQLANQPASNVTLSVASSAAGEGTVSPPGSLTFSTANWDTRQAVTVTAVDDDIDRDDSFTVDFAVTTGDSANYTTSLALSNVTVLVTDDDTAGLALFDAATGSDAPMSITTTEGATTDSFYVALESEPTGTVTVTISGLDATEHTSAPPSTLTFTTGNWNTRQEITLTGVDDNDVDGDQTYDITLTPTGGGYESVTAPTVSITNTDTDTAELTIADMMVNEDADTATVTVTLSAPVTVGDVTVNATTADGTATAGEDYTAITSQTLTFTAGSTSETLDITISDDDIDEVDETFTVMLDAPMTPPGVTPVSITDATATVTITDDEITPTAITLSVNPSTVAETASATTITVTATLDGTAVLTTPTDVVVTVGGGTATVTTDYTATPSTLTITIPALALSGTGTFMITPVDDSVDDSGETITISGTSGSFTVSTTTLTIVEAGILVYDEMTVGTEISTVMIDEANSDILYVQLASQPAGNVTLSVTSDDTNEGTVTPSTLTFSTTNWATRQALTVTAVNDNIDRDGDSFMVDFMITSGDSANYTSSLALPSVAVTVTDDDTASDTINLSVSPDRVTETAGATTITVTATIDGTVVLPTATDVMVTISDGTATGGDTDYTATPTTLTITVSTLMTSGSGTFSITPVADDVSDNGETITISGTSGSFTTVASATLTIIEFSEQDQQAIEQTVAAAASGVTQVVTEQIGIRLAKRTSAGSAQDRQSLSSIDWQDRLAKFTYEGLQRLDSEADMSLDWLLQAAGGDGQLLMPLGVESLTLWATGGHISTKGDGVADYDGDVNSFILGVDNELANDWLAGVAISYSDSEIDYTMNGSGETEQTLYGVHPYMSRNISEALTLWFTVGYGFGDIDFSHTSHGRATSDVTQWMAAGGLEQQIITNTPWQGALRIKGLWGNAEVDAATYDRGATIAKVDSDFWRARIESEMGYNFPLLDGNVRPYAIVGGRWDHNDAIVSGDEWHIDIGGGVEFSDNAFALDISVRTQITEGDTEEDSIFATGSLTYDLEQDGQGLQIALSRPLNNTSPAWDSHSFNEVTDTASGLSGAPLTSELAYGWTVRPFGLEGALQTYVQNSFESSDRHYAVGLELAVNALTLSFETGYHDHAGLVDSETDNTGLESMFKTKIKW